MTHVRLKGLNRTRKRHADGTETVYWYAWKGGPRLPGKPGSPEFMAAYNAAVADRKGPRSDTLAGLVTLYKSKPEYLQLADSTRREWARWLDRITLHEIGGLPLRVLDDRRVRADLIDWRDEHGATPRAADYGIQVLSRVLAVAVDRGILSMNRAAGIEDLYSADRSDLIWEATDIAAFAAGTPAPVSQALRLACLTGLRRGDLMRLRWADVGDLAISLSTRKSRRKGADQGKLTATIPILKDTRALLAEIGRRDATEPVLLNSAGGPWGENSLSHRIKHFADKAGVQRSLHNGRGTFCTRLCLAGLTDEEIADIMGWERDRVRQIRARYVDSERVVRALVQRIAKNESGA